MTSQTDQEAQQQLFADTLIKLQIHSALAKEHIHHNKSPLPLLAQSCSLLDNLPTSSTSTPHWTTAQRALIEALKIDAWTALADACIQANDLIQAEASLQRLATLQDNAAGPFSWRAQKRNSSSKKTSSTSLSESSNGSNGTANSGPTEDYRQATSGLIQTWGKLRQVYNDMGKVDMANNFGKRIQKMNELLKDPPFPGPSPITTTTSS
ncbi:hypothetical protein BGZ95_010456 [Linnemannia exigua]|uniref:Uncharacterized protein n=1 Tax=Linnemannia exigua TaxID=604196 RepID=A0AAD4H9G5_9FUNG|nr:hypothetical protein BGZ95_010456 [Linnemannia exigua]